MLTLGVPKTLSYLAWVVLFLYDSVPQSPKTKLITLHSHEQTQESCCACSEGNYWESIGKKNLMRHLVLVIWHTYLRRMILECHFRIFSMNDHENNFWKSNHSQARCEIHFGECFDYVFNMHLFNFMHFTMWLPLTGSFLRVFLIGGWEYHKLLTWIWPSTKLSHA